MVVQHNWALPREHVWHLEPQVAEEEVAA